MFYYLYEIKNLINNKIYRGVHKTNDLNDGYMGSGKVITAAIKKYGIENFTKVILEQFDTSAAMYAREDEVVNKEFLARDDVYNLRRGGLGGFDYIHQSDSVRAWRSKGGKQVHSLMKENKTGQYADDFVSPFSNRELQKQLRKLASSPKAIEKKKRTYAEIGHQQGDKNSQAGTMWITNDLENKKIKKTESIPLGFRKGRAKIMG